MSEAVTGGESVSRKSRGVDRSLFICDLMDDTAIEQFMEVVVQYGFRQDQFPGELVNGEGTGPFGKIAVDQCRKG